MKQGRHINPVPLVSFAVLGWARGGMRGVCVNPEAGR